VEGAETPFYRPHEESVYWSVRDPDMSDQESRYVPKMLLELDLGTEHVQCRDLTQVKAERLNMSGLGTGFVW
jgi:hypothetical protein